MKNERIQNAINEQAKTLLSGYDLEFKDFLQTFAGMTMLEIKQSGQVVEFDLLDVENFIDSKLAGITEFMAQMFGVDLFVEA